MLAGARLFSKQFNSSSFKRTGTILHFASPFGADIQSGRFDKLLNAKYQPN